MARGRLAFAQTGELDRDVVDRVGEHLGRGDDQVGGSFWGSVWDDTKDIAEAGAMVGLGALTGGAADMVIGGLGALGEAAFSGAADVESSHAQHSDAVSYMY